MIFLKKCLRKVTEEELSEKIQILLFEILEKTKKTINKYLDIKGGILSYGIPLSEKSEMKKEKAIINIISKDPNEILEVSDIYDLNEIIEILKINNCLDEHIEILKEKILDLLEDAVTNYDYEYEFDKAVNQTENKEIEISEAYYAERIYEDGFLNIDTCVLDENEILERILSEISLINLKERYYEYNIDDYNDYNDDYRSSDFYSEEKIIDNLFENL